MRSKLFRGDSSERLTLLFAGWGMDDAPFASFPKRFDTWVVWDYADLRTGLPDVPRDRPVDLVAWSMGVWAATQVLDRAALATATTVNGTPWPIDETRGIPPTLFDATLAGLSEAGLARFRRRMCGAAGLAGFLAHVPTRDVEDLRRELTALGEGIRARPERPFAWTRAVACEGDRIFPLAAQRAAFPEALVRPGAHWAPEIFEALLGGRAP